MLIRIGDEKREVIDAHLNILKTKILELFSKEGEEESQRETLSVFSEVVGNMPQKTLVYACLIALIAVEAPAKAEVILTQTVQ
jgi:hypothetical protein